MLTSSVHQDFASHDLITEAKDAVRDFLTRIQYQPLGITPDSTLRAAVSAEVVSWEANINPHVMEVMIDTGCTTAESTYSHTSRLAQLFIAIFTAYWVYIDDSAAHKSGACADFVRHLVAREEQPDPVLRRAAAHLAELYQCFPSIGADAITASCLDAFMGMHVEEMTSNGAIVPGATRYPYFLRLRTGLAAAYSHFNFIKGWRDPANVGYLQVLPELDHITVAVNDIISFYKESIVGETNNYIYLRATAEKKTALVVLTELVEETVDTVSRIEAITAEDPELRAICRSYIMGYVEFHFRAKRYRLDDLHMKFETRK
ncbi:terpenoid synthase [Trametes meyenii]|nr:terpenoid synthase [Trametes meyenii]